MGLNRDLINKTYPDKEYTAERGRGEELSVEFVTNNQRGEEVIRDGVVELV
ncbi:MAG: hypothetical protein JRJ19_03295 [Deltaproteobacteria bacterium]|nr:hypothetical protein [Deltaproteobacteria bacterium]MBW1871060.1 hypothetical protein [Deltaproteobacteria bacterium]